MASAAPAISSEHLVLGRYLPLRPLGSGGSGSVWLARDQQTGAEIALKIIDREGKAASRAEREAAVARRLRHERCQRAHAIASDARHVYIAYEYVAGKTLREAIRRRELDDRSALEAAAQILDALAHAHARGIVHRDVKPANVLLADSPDVSIRLLDFGLAQFSGAETLTAAGDVPGTLAYISPERLRGQPGSWSSDVWSVGVLLWEALAGRHPFWAPSLLETARRIQAGAPPLAQVRPDLPPRVAAAVQSALTANPARRPTAARLAKALRGATVPRSPAVVLPLPRRPSPPPAAMAARALPAGLAALFAGWTAATLPFYPGSWAAALAALAACLMAIRARSGLAFALAVPVLPLGNASLGLALLYTAFAAAWFGLFARRPRAGLGLAAGPLLAPIYALGLLPLLLLRVDRWFLRAALAGGGVLAAAIVAGVAGKRSLRFGATDSPVAAAEILVNALTAHPRLVSVALVVAAAAALLPPARRAGPIGLAAVGALTLATVFFPAPDVGSIPLAAAACLSCVALALWDRGLLQRCLRLRFQDVRALPVRASAPPSRHSVG